MVQLFGSSAHRHIREKHVTLGATHRRVKVYGARVNARPGGLGISGGRGMGAPRPGVEGPEPSPPPVDAAPMAEPRLPKKEEVAKHKLTHCPYQPRCQARTQAKGNSFTFLML